MKKIATTVALLCTVASVTACGGGTKETGASQAEVKQAVADALASQAASQPTAPPVTEVAATPSQAAAAAPAPAADKVNFSMPNFVGMNLQDAQNKVQTLGIFYSVSHDMLGSRNQIIDSNWKVCNQTPAAGTRIQGAASDFEGKFDFGSVKLTETCP